MAQKIHTYFVNRSVAENQLIDNDVLNILLPYRRNVAFTGLDLSIVPTAVGNMNPVLLESGVSDRYDSITYVITQEDFVVQDLQFFLQIELSSPSVGITEVPFEVVFFDENGDQTDFRQGSFTIQDGMLIGNSFSYATFGNPVTYQLSFLQAYNKISNDCSTLFFTRNVDGVPNRVTFNRQPDNTNLSDGQFFYVLYIGVAELGNYTGSNIYRVYFPPNEQFVTVDMPVYPLSFEYQFYEPNIFCELAGSGGDAVVSCNLNYFVDLELLYFNGSSILNGASEVFSNAYNVTEQIKTVISFNKDKQKNELCVLAGGINISNLILKRCEAGNIGDFTIVINIFVDV